MPRQLFEFDAASLDVNNPALDTEGIEAINPHRHEFRLLDKVLTMDLEAHKGIGYAAIREDQFWCRGHIPGRPLFPGVLQLEAAAQLCSIIIHKSGLVTHDKFFGLIGFEDIRFRKQVVPGDDLIILAQTVDMGRIAKFAFQSLVDGKIVNQGKVLGSLI